MVIISKTILVEFGTKNQDAAEALNMCYEVSEMANWKSLADIKRSFNSVDFVGNDRYVFNIRGN